MAQIEPDGPAKKMPPPREVRYVFGRLNLIAAYQDKKEFLFKGLRTDNVIQARGFGWGFAESGELHSEQGLFLTGLLVKYRPEATDEVFDPKTHVLGDKQVENKVIAKARFFLHVKSGLIAYRVIGAVINDQSFRGHFKKLFEEAHENLLVDVEIQSIDERSQIFEAIRRLDSISRVVVVLHPSNPNNAELWRSTDDRLKKLEAGSYREQIDAKRGGPGLKIEGDKEVKGKITMAADGYGKADVTGQVAGKAKTVSTQRKPVSAAAPSDDEAPDRILKGLGPSMKEIFGRFEK
jgi:hypothetical protein